MHICGGFLKNYHFSKKNRYFVIITDYVTNRIHFEALRKRDNVKYILLFFNPLARPLALNASKYASYFDLVVTIDPEDAKQKGWVYYPQIYSKSEVSQDGSKKTDTPKAYFIGYDKNRGQFLYNISKRLQEIGIDYSFKVLKGFVSNSQFDTFTYLSSPIPYEQVIADLCQADCIIDILQPGQTGVSIRYAEAICYNKILITDNKTIKELPYYDEEYMHVIEDACQIKKEWFNHTKEVNYHYKGDFSPRFFLETVKELIPDSSRGDK